MVINSIRWQVNKEVFAGLVSILMLAISAFILWPGLKGSFLFDDFSNLVLLDKLVVHEDLLSGISSYLNSGWAGPTKRPVAMASFLIEYPSWPSDPAPFKYTNILLHLMTALLVCWLALLLAKRSDIKELHQLWFAVLVMGLFALHPLQVSTTLYVIQRMTILATLFSVAALIAYLKGTERLMRGDRRGWWLILTIYPACTLLAIFSKESGVLTAFFTAVIAFTLGRGLSAPPKWGIKTWEGRLHWMVTYGPALLLALAMLIHFGMTMVNDPELRRREFTVIERLLTESRIIWSYLYDIFIPKIQTAGLYHDNYLISKGLLAPVTTLLAIVGLTVTTFFAVIKRKTWPFLALAVLGFLAGHALESTYIGLELYFEHRNYMPVIFLFLAIAWLLIRLAYTHQWAAVTIAILLLAGLATFTYQRVQLWSNPLMLMLMWAEASDGSERAMTDAANQLQIVGNIPQALIYAERGMQSNPEKPRPVLYALAMQCRYGNVLPKATVELAQKLLRSHVYHQATYNYVKRIRELKEGGGCNGISIDQIRMLVKATFDNDTIRSGNIKALEYYELGNLALLDDKPEQAIEHYQQALSLRGDTQVGLVEVARLASAGYASLALSHLRDVREHNARRQEQAVSTSDIREFFWVDSELNRLEAILLKEQSEFPEPVNE